MNLEKKMTFESPTEEVIRAFSALRSDPNFVTIIEWLRDCMIVKAIASTQLENEKIRNWEDGKVQAMECLSRYHSESKAMMEKMSDSWQAHEASKVGGY
jgi:hypothetical protein